MNLKRYIKVKWFQLRGLRKSIKIHSTSNISIGSSLEGCNSIGKYSSFGGILGFGTYIGTNCNISATVGRYCCIGNFVRTPQGNHPIHGWVSLHPAFFSVARQANFTYVNENKFEEYSYADSINRTAVVIGNDVWIGDNALILAGVKIADGAVIAAGAVVVHDVPPYAVVGGVPAKVIKYRFTEEQISSLLNIKWWEKKQEWLCRNASRFEDIDQFIEFEREHHENM